MCQLHISLTRAAQICLELHFCVELHTKKSPATHSPKQPLTQEHRTTLYTRPAVCILPLQSVTQLAVCIDTSKKNISKHFHHISLNLIFTKCLPVQKSNCYVLWLAVQKLKVIRLIIAHVFTLFSDEEVKEKCERKEWRLRQGERKERGISCTVLLPTSVVWWAVRRYELSYRAASAKKIKNNKYERYDQRTNKNISNYIGGLVFWAADVCFRAAFAQLGPVSSVSLGQFFLVM